MTAQTYRIFIRTTPERLWEAITRPEFTRQYFYGSAVRTDERVGGEYHMLAPDGETLWSDGQILAWEPPRRLVHTWRSLYDPALAAEPASRVTWEIEQTDGICQLTVTHDELDASPATAKGVDGGWMFILSGLKSVVETGAGLSNHPS